MRSCRRTFSRLALAVAVAAPPLCAGPSLPTEPFPERLAATLVAEAQRRAGRPFFVEDVRSATFLGWRVRLSERDLRPYYLVECRMRPLCNVNDGNCTRWVFRLEEGVPPELVLGGRDLTIEGSRAKHYQKLAAFGPPTNGNSRYYREEWEWRGTKYTLEDRDHVDYTKYEKLRDQERQFYIAALAAPDMRLFLAKYPEYNVTPTPTPIPPTPTPITREARERMARQLTVEVTCSAFGSVLPLFACLQHSSLDVVTRGARRAYGILELAQMGSAPFRQSLDPPFAVGGVNTSETEGLMLTVAVRNGLGQRVCFDQAGVYGRASCVVH